ncbi:hypothetical protein ACWCQQ_46070, partial [Streptomyces sp. NPDC002143]
EGVTQFSYPNDKVNALSISGRTGAGVKEIACRFTLGKLLSGARKASSRATRASHGDSTDRVETSQPEEAPAGPRRAA